MKRLVLLCFTYLSVTLYGQNGALYLLTSLPDNYKPEVIKIHPELLTQEKSDYCQRTLINDQLDAEFIEKISEQANKQMKRITYVHSTSTIDGFDVLIITVKNQLIMRMAPDFEGRERSIKSNDFTVSVFEKKNSVWLDATKNKCAEELTTAGNFDSGYDLKFEGESLLIYGDNGDWVFEWDGISLKRASKKIFDDDELCLQTVNNFIHFLGQQNWADAYLLSKVPGWGKYENFKSPKAFGGITKTTIHEIINVADEQGRKVVSVNASFVDKINGSYRYNEKYFLLKIDNKWIIVEIKVLNAQKIIDK